jgi:small subunit ribosomal protein S1
MAALLEQAPEYDFRPLSHGDIVEGTVVRIDPDEVLVDIGSKSEGIISNKELGNRGEAGVGLEKGERIKVFVMQPESKEGNIILSLKKAKAEGVWLVAEEKSKAGEALECQVLEQNKGGLIVNVLGLRGFLPASQVLRAPNLKLEDLVGTKVLVKILEVNRQRNRLIVSQKAANEEERARLRDELFSRLEVGSVVPGKVSGLTSYGAFVNLGGADGLIHISELSWNRIEKPSEVVNVGDELKVKIIKLDPELSRISLSLRQVEQDPWEDIEARFPVGMVCDGRVTKTTKYGAFVHLADGVEGLLHISEISEAHVARTEDAVHVGQMVNVRVINVDSVRRRISLSMRPEGSEAAGEEGEGAEGAEASAEPAVAGEGELSEPAVAALPAPEGSAAEVEEEAAPRASRSRKKAAAEEPASEAEPRRPRAAKAPRRRHAEADADSSDAGRNLSYTPGGDEETGTSLGEVSPELAALGKLNQTTPAEEAETT